MQAPHNALTNGHLPVAAIVASKTNPRKTFTPAALEELTNSVRTHGVLQPIVVRPLAKPDGLAAWELVAGERRWRAAKAAGLEVMPAVVHNLTDVEALEVQVVENLQREGLHELEEAEGYEALGKVGRTVDEIATKVGKSRGYVYMRLKLLALGPDARKAFREGKIPATVAVLLARIPVLSVQSAALQDVTRGGECASFREAQGLITRTYMLKLVEAPFNRDDAKLHAKAGACGPCPKRTGNTPELFGDVKNADVCTDPVCFAAKRAAHFAAVRAQAEADGLKVVSGKAAKAIIPSASNYLAHDADYVALSAPCYEDKKARTYAQLYGKDAPPVVMIEHPQTLELIAVVPKKAAAELLKARDIHQPGKGRTADDKEAERKAKLETAVRERILAAVRLASGTPTPADGLLIAQDYFGRIGFEERKRLVRAWWPDGAPGVKADPTKLRTDVDYESAHKLEAAIPKMEPAELLRLMLLCAVVDEVGCNQYQAKKATGLLAVAERLHVDAAAIRKELTDVARDKAKAKATRLAGALIKSRAAKKAAKALPAPPKSKAKPAAKTKPAARAEVSK
jgi:ParB/RepB/Spo0J family partition protein